VQAELRRIETVRETRGSLYADVALLALCREMAVEKAPAVYPELRRRSVGEERTIVFFHHKAVGSLYREWLQKEGIPFVFIDGGTPMHARDAIIERWKAPDGPRLGLCSLCATSTGLNLQFCTRILVAEMTFHSTHHTQSEARIYRIGQTKPVEITYLLLAGSTDHMLWSALNRKILVEATLFDDRVPRKRPRVQPEESDIIPL
jgi:SNF2 family DNA or RNA helicase